MKTNQSTFALGTSLLLVFLFVIAVNLGTSSRGSAVGPSRLAVQEQDDDFDPLQEEDEVEEVWDEEQDPDDDEGAFEDDAFEDEEEELEAEIFGMEMERRQIELSLGRLEVVNRLSEIAADEVQTAAYAIMHLQEFVEDEEEVIEMLEEVIASDGVDLRVRDLAKMKLVEVYAYADQFEMSKKTLKSMILNK